MFKTLTALGLAVAVLTGTAPPAAAAGKLDQIRARGSIIVGIDFSHPPFGAINDKNEKVGSDLDTAELLAKDLGVKLETVNVSGPNRIPFLISNKIDVAVATMSVTADRRKVIDFSAPYGVVPLNIAAPSADKVSGPADLAGKSRCGGERRYSGHRAGKGHKGRGKRLHRPLRRRGDGQDRHSDGPAALPRLHPFRPGGHQGAEPVARSRTQVHDEDLSDGHRRA